MTCEREFWLQQCLQLSQQPTVKKFYRTGQLIFVRNMILPIKHRVDWQLRRLQKHKQRNRDKSRENKHRVDYNYKVGGKVMLINHTAHKYETPLNGPFL